ncbi:MAG: SDR family oxidoreductase [Alphaproteobacteria bacterium]|nr:SDR family oxidoreductase [Alphaproteobacteria bacterium]MDP6516081.1 SDR family oxidoreductase [Alphaproteobacteria bacterium]
MSVAVLSGKTAIVTGGAGGIGRVLVRALIEAGARVAILDADGGGLEHFARALDDDGHEAATLAVRMDVSDPDDCAASVARTRERFGAIHILINNAALGMGVVRTNHITDPVRIDEITPEIWQRVAAVNFSGPFYMTRAAAPHFLARGWGRVINITTSFFTMLRGSYAPYGPCKAGLEAWSAGLAKEFAGQGITVNVVVPGGPTDTPMVPPVSGFDRAALIRPEAMAPPILWLCSSAADQITGARIVAAKWDPALEPEAAAAVALAPSGWPDLARDPVWPGGRPEDG